MLPLPVLERAASELVSYGDSGMSVLEMSHRSPDYEPIIKAAEASLRKLMNIPDEYAVLFCRAARRLSLPRYRSTSCPRAARQTISFLVSSPVKRTPRR